MGSTIDKFPFYDPAMPVISDRPAKLGSAPEYNGYKNVYPPLAPAKPAKAYDATDDPMSVA